MTGFTGCATAVTGMFSAVADDAADTGTFGALADDAAISRVSVVPADAAVVMGNVAGAAVTTDITAGCTLVSTTDDADGVVSFNLVSVAGPEHAPSGTG